MPAPQSLLDPTGTVSLGDETAVADAAERILEACFGAGSFDAKLLRASFDHTARLFAGTCPGYLACDMPYHDLRHSLATALVVARLVAGHQTRHRGTPDALTPDQGLLAVLLGLLHDAGYLRTTAEAALCGPQLAAGHEARSVRFAGEFLRTTSLAPLAGMASMILATELGSDLDRLFAGRDRAAVIIGRMLGSADLLAQAADRWYPERCYCHLYPELVAGGGDRTRTADGREQTIVASAEDLLRKSPGFLENVVCSRLDRDFQGIAADCLASHFGGSDPYAEGIRRNGERLRRMAAGDAVGLLQGVPATTTTDLPAIYLPPAAQGPGSAGAR